MNKLKIEYKWEFVIFHSSVCRMRIERESHKCQLWMSLLKKLHLTEAYDQRVTFTMIISGSVTILQHFFLWHFQTKPKCCLDFKTLHNLIGGSFNYDILIIWRIDSGNYENSDKSNEIIINKTKWVDTLTLIENKIFREIMLYSVKYTVKWQ